MLNAAASRSKLFGFAAMILTAFLAACGAGGTNYCDDLVECPIGEECKAKKCVPAQTIAPPTMTCSSDAGCLNGQKCIDSKCVTGGTTSCTSDAGCLNGQVCIDSKCVPKTSVGMCRMDSECPAGQQCTGGTCVPKTPPATCTTDTQCLNGQRCQGGTCVNQARDCSVTRTLTLVGGWKINGLKGVPGTHPDRYGWPVGAWDRADSTTTITWCRGEVAALNPEKIGERKWSIGGGADGRGGWCAESYRDTSMFSGAVPATYGCVVSCSPDGAAGGLNWLCPSP